MEVNQWQEVVFKQQDGTLERNMVNGINDTESDKKKLYEKYKLTTINNLDSDLPASRNNKLDSKYNLIDVQKLDMKNNFSGDEQRLDNKNLSHLRKQAKKAIKIRKIKKGISCTAWILCCPVMWLAVFLREGYSEDEDDETFEKDDVLLPWQYDVNLVPASSS